MNVNRPSGLIAVRHNSGGTPRRSSAYAIASGLANDIFIGDLVKTIGSADANSGFPQINKVAAGETSVGVFAGVSYTDVNGDVIFTRVWRTGTVFIADPQNPVTAIVYDDPETIFRVQVNDATGLAAADVGQKADISVVAGDFLTGRSASQLDKTGGLSATAQLKIMRLYSSPENAFGEFADAEVLIDEHENRSALTAT